MLESTVINFYTVDFLVCVKVPIKGTANGKPSSNKNTNVDNFDAKTATNK
ncbi:Protein of unknown function [Bacillus cereus]|nr:Protein of unknown function [Bacillus cereus]